jgi:hypothetical protein
VVGEITVESESPELPTFQRQRRNVFIVSFALLFALQTNLTIDKLSFFGNELRAGVPQAAATWLWWLWAYWIVRMVQALLEIPHAPVRATYVSNYQRWINRIAFKKIVQRDQLKAKESPSRRDPILKPGTWTVNRLDTWRALWDCEIQNEYSDELGRRISEKFADKSIELNGLVLLIPKALALLQTIFFTMKFTEYVLPFVVGIAPVAKWFVNRFA